MSPNESWSRNLRDKIESLPGILEVDIAGDREDLLEVIIDPMHLEDVNQSADELLAMVARNNQLVAAGALDTGQGRFPVKVPGLFENVFDVLNLPVKVSGDRVVTFEDIAVARRTFKDSTGFARVNGQPAVALDVSKRIGTNIIDTIAHVREVVSTEQSFWPNAIQVVYTQDKSQDIRTMLEDLQNNVITAVLLVMVVIVATLGLRTTGLVDVAIPGSFLAGILVIALFGLTINIVVLFSLMMAVGMLLDGAIVVTELADRKTSGRLVAQSGLRGCGNADGLANNSGNCDHPRGLHAVALLAGRCRSVHGVSANYFDCNAQRITRHGVDLRASARLVVRQTRSR
jgi:multidrug efflux pump